MPIYTKKGDQGTTSLFDGTRIPKSNIRAHALGSIDDINSSIGLATSLLDSNQSEISNLLKATQKLLLTVGSQIAGGPVKIREKEIENLEAVIDHYQNTMPKLTNFILPGGHPSAASLHLARTKARFAERIIAELHEKETVSENILKFINRLSDYLFVLARAINFYSGFTDETWIGSNRE